MDRHIHNEKLVSTIQEMGAKARDHRQVQGRLEQLLVDRIQQLISEAKDSVDFKLSVSDATRRAYASSEFQKYIDELVEVKSQSLQARIQYETHMMLYEARQSLRLFAKLY